MKKVFFLPILFMSLAIADEDCAAPAVPTLPAEVTTLAEVIVDVDGKNNTCPSKPYPDQFASAKNLEELKTQVNSRLSALGLTAEWAAGREGPSSWSAFEDTPEDLIRAKRLADVTLVAFSQYPAGFFNKAQLSKVKLIKDLIVRSGGSNQKRMAVPEPRNDRLYFAENNEPGLTGCLEEIEMRMHHEFFHLMEGTFHRNEMRPNISEWNRINPEGFSYGEGGQASYSDKTGFADLERPQNGFSTGYATYGAEEDRSEVFAYMMTGGYSERQAGWATVDPVLRRKVQYVQNFLRTNLEVPEEYISKFNSPRLSSSP